MAHPRLGQCRDGAAMWKSVGKISEDPGLKLSLNDPKGLKAGPLIGTGKWRVSSRHLYIGTSEEQQEGSAASAKIRAASVDDRKEPRYLPTKRTATSDEQQEGKAASKKIKAGSPEESCSGPTKRSAASEERQGG